MAARRAITEEAVYYQDEEGNPIDIDNLTDEEMHALAKAYAQYEGEDDYEDDDCEGDDNDDEDDT